MMEHLSILKFSLWKTKNMTVVSVKLWICIPIIVFDPVIYLLFFCFDKVVKHVLKTQSSLGKPQQILKQVASHTLVLRRVTWMPFHRLLGPTSASEQLAKDLQDRCQLKAKQSSWPPMLAPITRMTTSNVSVTKSQRLVAELVWMPLANEWETVLMKTLSLSISNGPQQVDFTIVPWNSSSNPITVNREVLLLRWADSRMCSLRTSAAVWLQVRHPMLDYPKKTLRWSTVPKTRTWSVSSPSIVSKNSTISKVP